MFFHSFGASLNIRIIQVNLLKNNNWPSALMQLNSISANMGVHAQKNASDIAKVERFENITKSKQDNRLYRGIKLNNGLRALLISDSITDKSAASLVVNVGALNDFKELPGIAHFLEHMLFLGSKKYPQENSYQKFVTEHAGQSNAYTAEHQTNFHFDISPDFLPQALDRFAQFFLEPSFEESVTEREINAVNSEHEKNIPVDIWRIRQLEKSLSKPDHPYNSFSTGNKNTLDVIPKAKGIDVRKKLLEFHNNLYSANLMSLVVLGRESLDELEEIVTELFENVKNKDLPPFIYKVHPYGPDQLKRKLHVVPVKDIRSLKLSFSAPDVTHQYKTAPDHYISHLIGHEGPGSLYSVLRERGLCNSLSAGLYVTAPGFAFFIISIELTKEALSQVDEIIALVFQYIKLLNEKGIQEWIFEEKKKIEEVTFLFKDKELPSSYVVQLAAGMSDYPIEDILSANYIVDEWKPYLIEEFLSILTPDNMKVVIASKSFEDIADQVEPWYGTKYKVENIPETLIEKWKNVDLAPDNVLHLPTPNEFIPENFDLYPLDENATKHPCVLYESHLSRIWFKQDDEYLLPKLGIQLELFSPLAFLDPNRCNLTGMFINLLKDSLNEYAYDARLAGLSWAIAPTKYGFHFAVYGYNEKLPVLLQKVIRRMCTFKVDLKRFEIIKESLIRSLKNFETEQPHQHANFFLSYLLAERGWTKEDLLAVADSLDAKTLGAFLPDLFSRLYFQGLIHGNCNKAKAMEIVKLFEEPFSSATALLPQQLMQNREINLKFGSHSIYEVYTKYHSSSCLCIYIQCSLESTSNNSIIELFAQIIDEPCYDKLRTQEQLGYIVASGVRRINGVQGLLLLVQSEKHPVFLDSRAEEFLKDVKNLLENMSEDEFEVHKTALATKKLEKPKQMKLLSSKYWAEISSRHYNFNRVEMEVAHLRTLKKEHILAFYEELISAYSERRRKLAIHVISKVTNPDIPKDIEEEVTKIEDVIAFKSTHSLCPLPEPYIKIPPVGTRSKL